MNLFVIFLMLFLRAKSEKNVPKTGNNYNILLIIVDDLRPIMDENITLPRIQKMATTGVTFKNAFAQQALCAPSRNSMLTGRRPDSLHLYDTNSYWRYFTGNFSTLPQFFKEHGYDTYSAGKVFHPGVTSNHVDDIPYSWTHQPFHPSSEKYKDAKVCYDRKTKKKQKNLICPVNPADQPEKTLPDLQTVKFAINILKRRRNMSKPFLLAVGFHKPHIPLRFPEKYLAKFPFKTIEPPKHPKIPKKMPLVAWHPWTDLRKRDDIRKLDLQFRGIMPKHWALKIKQSYYAAAAYIDDIIGILMRHVDKKKTIVVLTSDHGWSLGENGLWAKYSNFDVALRVPLIFKIPKMRRKTINTPVELVDLFPTMVELAGIQNNISKCHNSSDKSPLCYDGRSLVPLMQKGLDENLDNSSFAISQYPRPGPTPVIYYDQPVLKEITIMGYSIRTKRYRYTEWVGFNHRRFTINWNQDYGVELYDHVIDPEETNSVHKKPEYRYMRKKLSAILRSKVDLKRGY